MITPTLTVIRHDVAVVMRMYWSWIDCEYYNFCKIHMYNMWLLRMIVLILSLIRAPIIVLNNLRAINFSTSELCLFLVLVFFFFFFEGGGIIWALLLYRYFKQLKETIFWFVKKFDKYPLLLYASCMQCTLRQ